MRSLFQVSAVYTARPYRYHDDPTVRGIYLDMKWSVPSTALSTIVFLELDEAKGIASQLEAVYSSDASQAILKTYYDPDADISFAWHDPIRAIAKLSGHMLIRGWGDDADSDAWRCAWRIDNFCFESFYLQRISQLIQSALNE